MRSRSTGEAAAWSSDPENEIRLSGYSHGDVITAVGGGAVSGAINNAPSGFPQFAPDLAVAFDSNQTGTADPDLQYNAGWTGGNTATH